MKISIKQLRTIIREEIQRVNESTGEAGFEVVDLKNAGHLEVGNSYRVKGMRGLQRFEDWLGGEAELMFVDQNDGDEWRAYESDGTYCWGSSCTPLEVSEEHAEEYAREELDR